MGPTGWVGGLEVAQTERFGPGGRHGEEAQGHTAGGHGTDILANHWQLAPLHFQMVPKQMEYVEPLKEKCVIYTQIKRNLVKSAP